MSKNTIKKLKGIGNMKQTIKLLENSRPKSLAYELIVADLDHTYDQNHVEIFS